MHAHGIILAGVHKWDESALAHVYPRVLWPIRGQPLIQHILQWLQGSGIRQTCVCANSDTEILRQQLHNGQMEGIDIAYIEDPMPRGPAGCMRDAALRSDAELFLVMGPFFPIGLDARRIIQAHLESQASLTLVVSKVETHNGNGSFALEPVDLYCVSRSAIEEVRTHVYEDLKEVLIPRLYKSGKRVVPYVVPESAIQRLNSPKSYLEVCAYALQRTVQGATRKEGYRLAGEALIHESAIIDPQARLVGPVMVGPHSRVARDATLVGPTTIGPACVVEPHAIVSESVLWAHCRVGPGAILDHCVVTDLSDIESATVVRDTVWVRSRPSQLRGGSRQSVQSPAGKTPAGFPSGLFAKL